jgi:hypothetical protein
MAMMAPVEAVAHVLSEDLATDAHEIGCYPSSPGSILGSAAWFGAWALAVRTEHVVRLELVEPRDRRPVAEGAVSSAVIVEVQPAAEGCPAFG